MTYSVPATSSQSFRPYQHQSSRLSYPAPAAAPSYDYDVPAPQSQSAAANYKRRVEEPHYSAKHSLSAAVVSSGSSGSSSSSSAFSPLSLCSSVSSCSSSSSGSSSSAYSSPADTFDLEEMGDEQHTVHHYYQPHPHPPQQQQQAPQHHRHSKPAPTQALHTKPGRPAAPPQLHHQPAPQDSAAYYPAPQQAMPASASAQHVYGHSPSPAPSMTVSIPAANGGWKEVASSGVVRRREAALHSLVPAELPTAYLPAPLQPVVASAAEVVVDVAGKSAGGSKKKKGRSLRRCMDREKHSKAEQKRRGEMKLLFDQLQDISQCVYKDRIHILTLAIQTIQRQQDTIQQLQAQVKQGGGGKARGSKAGVKKEQSIDADATGAAVVVSGSSSPLSSHGELVSGKRAAVAAELDCEPAAVVKQEEEEDECEPAQLLPSPKKQRTSPHPRDVVDLSTEAGFGSSLPPLPPALHDGGHASTVSALASTSFVSTKPLHTSFSSSSLSTFVCSSGDTHSSFPYLMDEQPHAAQYHHAPAQHQLADDGKSQLAGHATTGAASYSAAPCMSPVFSFTAHPQHWWPSATDSTKH